MGRPPLRRSPRQRLRRNIRQKQELIHPALATRMILPALFLARYPPHEKYDCSKVNHGGLVLDVRAKLVFVYP